MLSIDVQGTRLDFEHSLVSLSKWEESHEKPFFAWTEQDKRTHEEMIDYFECMLLNQNLLEYIPKLTPEDHLQLVTYINAPRTATVVREVKSAPGPKENVTSELIYYWLVAFKVDWECQHWHLNRLLTLVKVCGAKSQAQEKVKPGQKDIEAMRRLNEERRRQLGTSG